MTRHFEFVGDDAQRHTVSEKSFVSPAEAQAHADKLIAEKPKKGYVEK